MDWCFIVNPQAGGGKAVSKWRKLKTLLIKYNISFEECISQSPPHAVELACDKALSGYRNFVAVGGDGSLNEVLQGLLLSETPLDSFTLTVVPCGTGNDWARFHAIPQTAGDWLKFFLNSHRLPHDVGLAEFGQHFAQHHVFMNIAGTGLDCHIVNLMGHAGGHSLRYYFTLLTSLYSYTAQSITMTVNNMSHGYLCPPKVTKHQHNALITMACIGRYGGGGMSFAPDACFNDGQLELISIEDMSFLSRLMSTPYLLNGQLNQHPAVFYRQTDSVEIKGNADEYFQCDGELIGKLPVKFSCYPEKINTLIRQ